MKIIEFGQVPPPFGGVTVHVRRLLDRLAGDGFEVTLVARRRPADIGEAISFMRWPTLPQYFNHLEFLNGFGPPFGDGILHLHGNPVFFAPLVYLHVRRGGSALITVHDQMVGRQLSRALLHERICFGLLPRSSSVRWIAVSEPVREFLQQRQVPADRISVIPAFLADRIDDSTFDLPTELVGFLRDHPLSMVVYGYRREFLTGRDLYGFDFAIDVLAQVLRSVAGAGLVILCPDATRDADSWLELADKAQRLGITRSVLFFLQAIPRPSSLWQQCTVMLRPTLTDGDSVAVREMLALGRSVIASNVVPRPERARVLSLESPEEWARMVLRCAKAADLSPAQPTLLRDGYAEIKQLILSFAATGA